MSEVTIETADPNGAEARACLATYEAELQARFPRGFDAAGAAAVPAPPMRAPHGVFLVARRGGEAIGCAGLRSHGDWGEVKKLWVAPAARRLGFARRLMAAVEASAREMGLGVMRLDTNSALPEAIALYRRSGWVEIDRFNDDPNPDIFFEKRLD